MRKFIAVAIGCVECNEKSWFIGFFDTSEEAKRAIYKMEERGEEFTKGLIEEVEIPTQ